MKTSGKTVCHQANVGLKTEELAQSVTSEEVVEVEKTNAPGTSDFVCSQEIEITETIGQAETNRQAPKNIESRKLLQGAMLQSNFQRAQGVKQPSPSTNAKTEKQEQQEFLESLKGFRYRKDTVEVPEKWAGDIAFLSKIALAKDVGLSGLPEDIRNNKEFLLHFLEENDVYVFPEDFRKETLLDKEIVLAMIGRNSNAYRELPEAMKRDDEVIDAAIGASPYSFRDIPEDKKTVSNTSKWIGINEKVLLCYDGFSQAAKEDVGVTLQYLKSNTVHGARLSDISKHLHNHVDVVSTLLETSNKYHETFAKLPLEMKEHPQVCAAYINHAKEDLQSYRFESHRRKQTSEYVSYEHALNKQTTKLATPLLASIDGAKHGVLQSGQKDALITETEIYAKLEETLHKDLEASLDTATDIFLMKQLLLRARSEGVEVRVAGTGEDTKETTAERFFDQAKLKKLETIVDKSLCSYTRGQGKEKIHKANKLDAHAVIPDELELAVFGYTTSDFRELNSSLRTGEISEKQQVYIDGIAEGLRQMPSHKGIVWRGTSLPAEVKAQYVPGKEIVEKAFLSTSYGEEPAFGGDTMYCIQLKDKGSAGKKIDHLSNFDHEKEVLVNAGTRFKVLAKEETTRKKWDGSVVPDKTIIYLQEM